MSNEILSVLEYMEKEKGIGRDEMIATISSSIKNAATKGVHAGQEIRVEISPRTGTLKAFSVLNVVDSVTDQETEIHLDAARKLKKDVALGEVIEKEIDPGYLGRIAAQTARQAIMQRIRQFEKDRIYDDYKDQVGQLVTGVVRRRERSNIIVDLGKAEAILPQRERIPEEEYGPGDRIRCLLLKIEMGNRGPDIILSRSNINFVRRLLDLEVAEIADGTVSIVNMVREPGYRTKIAVDTSDPKVDPVGACVGTRGARVKSIVRELGGEKIDIIHHYDDVEEMLDEALKPAIPRNVQIDEKNRRIYFEVAEDDLKITIGKKGQNARLTSRLLGWRLDIAKEEKKITDMDELVARASSTFSKIDGITEEMANILVEEGVNSLAVFQSGVELEDLIKWFDITEEQAQHILKGVQEAIEGNLSS